MTINLSCFHVSLNPICICGTDVETTTDCLLHCPLFSDKKLILRNNIRNINSNILNLNDSRFSEVLLFGGSSFNTTKNTSFKIHWRYSTIETSNKSVWSNVFWYVKVWINWKCVQYTIHWDKTQILKKIPLDKIYSTKNTLFFLLQSPTHHSFILICDFYMS